MANAPAAIRPPVDPDAKLPAAVKAAADRAEAAFKANYQPEETEEKPSDPPVEPPKGAETVEKKPDDPPVTAPITPEVTAPTSIDWEHRYKSMEGRYHAAAQQIQDRDKAIAGLNATLASLKPVEGNNGYTPTITADEEKEYGPEFLAVVAKRAQDALMPTIRSLEAKVAELSGVTAKTEAEIGSSARNSLFASLAAAVPNYEAINHDERFFRWLALPDPYSGDIRHKMLSAAFERNQAPQVIAFFKGFLQDEAVVVPPTAVTQVPPVTPQVTPRVNLTDLAAPGRAKDTGGDNPVQKPVITLPMITQFYADVSRGAYRTREAERAQMEQQIWDAQREGRLR